jgi:hypothetical protein
VDLKSEGVNVPGSAAGAAVEGSSMNSERKDRI